MLSLGVTEIVFAFLQFLVVNDQLVLLPPRLLQPYRLLLYLLLVLQPFLLQLETADPPIPHLHVLAFEFYLFLLTKIAVGQQERRFVRVVDIDADKVLQIDGIAASICILVFVEI